MSEAESAERTEETITSESSLDLSVTPDNPDYGTSTALEGNDPHKGHLFSFIGILLFTFVVYARPYEWSDSMLWLSRSALWIAISSLLVFVVAQLSLDGSIFAEKEAKLAILLLILSSLSIPLALDLSIAWNQFVDYSKVVLIFIIMASVLRTRLRLKTLLLLVLLITIALAIVAVRDFALGNVALVGGRIEGAIGGMFSNPNDLALHFVTITPIAVGLAWSSRYLLTKILYIIAALLIIAGIVTTFSRGGLLGLIVALGVIVWRLAPQNRLLLLGVFTGLLLLVPVVAGYSKRFSMEEASTISRTDELKRSVWVALHHPFGVGMGNYILYSNTNHATHNAYTQVWAEVGVGALCIYLALIWIPLRKLQNIAKVATSGGDNDIKFIAIGLEASMFGYIACSFFASVAFLWYGYYLIAFAISARRLASLVRSESDPVSLASA